MKFLIILLTLTFPLFSKEYKYREVTEDKTEIVTVSIIETDTGYKILRDTPISRFEYTTDSYNSIKEYKTQNKKRGNIFDINGVHITEDNKKSATLRIFQGIFLVQII